MGEHLDFCGVSCYPCHCTPDRPWCPRHFPLFPGRMLRLGRPARSSSLRVPHWCPLWVTVLMVGTSGSQLETTSPQRWAQSQP